MAPFILMAMMFSYCIYFGAGAASGILGGDEISHLQPCQFNLLCKCSKQGPEVGLIYCEDLPLGDVPTAINNSKAFALHLRRNGLRRIEEDNFHQTGLWKIEIRENHLSQIPDRAFAGLERSLGELDLSKNRLHRFPSKALRKLGRLKVIDLSENQILELNRDDFVGLEDILQVLSLAENHLYTLHLETFSGFQRLERLDLKGNSILSVEPLRSGTMKLGQLILEDNALDRIPFDGLAQLRSLHTINLANNRITSTYNVFFQGRISVDNLILDNNNIGPLPPFAFQNFDVLNRTSLRGNDIREVADDAFKNAKIQELVMADCSLVDLSQKAFNGLEASLNHLDLSFNKLKFLPEKLLVGFDHLSILILNDNALSFKPEQVLSGFGYQLQTVNLIGDQMQGIPFKLLNNTRILRTLGLSSMDERVSIENFEGFGSAVEQLSLTKNKIKSIEANAFRHVPGLKSLDISENTISKMEADAFTDVASSLTNLYMANGLFFSSMPSEPFRNLKALRSIDFSNNRITNLPTDLFHRMKELRSVNAQDNFIEEVPSQLFDSSRNPSLINVSLGFNYITTIKPDDFADLYELVDLNLGDNKIRQIHKNAIRNNGNLERLYLEGNQIELIEPEAFRNLPRLKKLDLTYNNLETLSFNWFDQVGTLSAFKLDLSHNAIQRLESSSTTRTGWSTYASIRTLDLSYNNISFVSHNFFEPIRSSLTHLILRNNQLHNISRDVYSGMEHLLWLDLGSNKIQLVDSDAFANARHLQVLYLDNNEISEVNGDMLRWSSTLRVVTLSYNKIRFLHDTLFKDTLVEILDVSHNRISKIPDECFSRITTTLRQLDLSHNEIAFINDRQVRKMDNLVYLDLSHNSISTLANNTFDSLSRLTFLDLSNNPLLAINNNVFNSMAHSLVHLNLAYIGQASFASFYVPGLLSLNISGNQMKDLPSDFFIRHSNLKEIDASNCQLTSLEITPWHTAYKLRALHLKGNQLTEIKNSTFASMKRIEYLNIQDLPIQILERGSLSQMSSLRHLAISTYDKIQQMDILHLLENIHVIRHLEIDVRQITLEKQLRGKMPSKVNRIVISGQHLEAISSSALQGIRSRSLTLVMRNTKIQELANKDLFHNLGQVRWLHLDLRKNNLKSLVDPSTSLYTTGTAGNSVFLSSLYISGNPWLCDCALGWVEYWMRKRRQFPCREPSCSNYQAIMRDMRLSTCRNRANSSLVTVLKTELECGYYRSNRASSSYLKSDIWLCQFNLITAFVSIVLIGQLTKPY